MKKLTKVFRSLLLALIIIGTVLCLPTFAVQKINSTSITPDLIFTDKPYEITVKASVASDPDLITTSVNLVRVDNSGNALGVLTRLYDDGTNGDERAGDNIFTTVIVMSNPAPATLKYKVSVAYKRTLKRLLSDILTLQVTAPGNRVAVYLPQGISPSSVAIQTPEGSFTLNPDGTFTMATQLPGPFLVTAKVQGFPVALSFFNPKIPGNSISCLETAVSLVMLSNMLFTVPSQLIPDALALIRNVNEVQVLGGVICLELSKRTDALVAPGQPLTSALNDAAKAVNDRLKAL
jgi:hypothetical protein